MRIADDFGLGRDHDQVILSLLEAGKLDGTSVMINTAIEPEMISQLRLLREKGAQIGLHINLTQKLPGLDTVWPLTRLMQPFGSLPSGVAATIQQQCRQFIELFGSAPDYYDGHQHCHCFWQIAPLLTQLPVIQQETAQQAWVRVPLPATWTGRWRNLCSGGFKVLIIMALAARARGRFIKAGLLVNRDFSGFLRLNDPQSVQHWLPRLLAGAAPDTLIMLHPGDAHDPIQCYGHAPLSRAFEAEILEESTENE